MKVVEMTAEERERYGRVSLALVEAINEEDYDRYRALPTDEGWEGSIDWWKEMFPIQIANFGRIAKAWIPTRRVVQIGAMGFKGGTGQMTTCIVRFEEPSGGALTFELNDEDKIIKTSVYIKQELANYDPKGEDARVIYELE